MSNLIRCQPVDFVGSHAAPRLCDAPAGRPGPVQVQEPIPVHVRIRPQGDGFTGLSRAPSGSCRLDRLPVGTLLDCAV